MLKISVLITDLSKTELMTVQHSTWEAVVSGNLIQNTVIWNCITNFLFELFLSFLLTHCGRCWIKLHESALLFWVELSVLFLFFNFMLCEFICPHVLKEYLQRMVLNWMFPLIYVTDGNKVLPATDVLKGKKSWVHYKHCSCSLPLCSNICTKPFCNKIKLHD